MKQVYSKSTILAQLTSVGLVTLFAFGCNGTTSMTSAFSGLTGGDKESTDGRSEDQEGDPQPVAGTNLVNYDNSAIDCTIMYDSKSGFDYFECYAATKDKDGKITHATGLEKGIEIAWSIPRGTVAPSCQPSVKTPSHVNELKFTCEFQSTENPSPPNGVNMDVKDIPNDKTKTLKYRPNWQNTANPFDVNNNGIVTPQDVLIIINFVLKNSTNFEVTDDPPPNGFLDVDGDGFITENDINKLIDFLNGDSGETRLKSQKNLSAWTNPSNNLDTNNDGRVTPVDVLIIINYVLKNGDTPVVGDPPGNYLDIDGDKMVTQKDAQIVIDYLNAQAPK